MALHSAGISEVSLSPPLARDNSKPGSLQLSQKPELMHETPRTKALGRLAALQMCSPGTTPSPMPLRRRLQHHSGVQEAVLPQKPCLNSLESESDVIFIDC